MLKLSTKGRYATRIMVHLAQGVNGVPVRKLLIARAENISPDYVEQIMMKLKAAGLVRSHRGARGGFSLARPPDAITVADVLAATEGPLLLAPCIENEDCTRVTQCVTRDVWKRANDALEAIFSETTIARLVSEAKKLQHVTAPMFEI